MLLAALPVGINVYLMAREFEAIEGPVATSMLLSTLLAAVTAPLALFAARRRPLTAITTGPPPTTSQTGATDRRRP